MRRQCLFLGACALICAACEPSPSSGVNIIGGTDAGVASVRVFDFVADLATSDSYVAITGTTPVTFNPLNAPEVTAFEQGTVGTWLAYVAVNEKTLAVSPAESALSNQWYTAIETGYSASGGTPALQVGWMVDTDHPDISQTEANARFILGDPSYIGCSITVGGVMLITSATLGAPAQNTWTAVPTNATSLVANIGGVMLTFTIPAPAAGSMHTYALVNTPGSSPQTLLLDITESLTGDAAVSAPISPSSD